MSSSSKRRADDETPSSSSHPVVLPLSDSSIWYYPSLGAGSDEEDADDNGRSNWGNKRKHTRWSRKGKMTSWGPAERHWEEEHARKRMRLLVPKEDRSPSPPTLPHLDRAMSPPLTAPYPPPNVPHMSYTSFVMDKAVTHTFRSNLLEELEESTNGLVEGESVMKRALGRLWQVLREETDGGSAPVVVPKQEEEAEGDEDGDEQDEIAKRVARAPDLTPSAHKLFLTHPDVGAPMYEPSHFTTPVMQQDSLEKALATLRELQDDGREYTERLEEIRETIGDLRSQRDIVFTYIRTSALSELQTYIAEY